MKISRLRLLGFKSFVEPTELLIEQGLTGVVGPNGCGKSNLLEALRWVMGETSLQEHARRRHGRRDLLRHQPPAGDATARKSRSFLDNAERRAPAEYNDTPKSSKSHDASNVRMVPPTASTAREVRARDVKILFEDAATGARSPALVRQGQIGEIVNAKPEQRRRILEDAAGIAGLHSRRHEAELRLRATEANLARLNDVYGSDELTGREPEATSARSSTLQGYFRRHSPPGSAAVPSNVVPGAGARGDRGIKPRRRRWQNSAW